MGSPVEFVPSLLLAVGGAAYLVRATWPPRRRRDEDWYEYYLRLIVFPVLGLYVTAVGVRQIADPAGEPKPDEYLLWALGIAGLVVLSWARDSRKDE